MNNRLTAEQIFHAAREKSDPAERAGFLDGACGNDVSMRAMVEGLLKADAEAGEFLRAAEEAPRPSPFTAPTLAATPRDQAGDMFGRYKLLQQIGEGGFGVVYMAEQREPVKRRVALKIIKLGMDTKQVIARFEAERQALAMMDHPNIAKVFDADSTEAGRLYFVMEYIKGVPILEYCDTERLDTKQRLDLFTKVCHAIQHAHQKGVIHRDIKPSNVLITMHDGVPVPKVIDFGIAKATNAELTTRTLFTEHRQMIGTPAYMSPEQAEMSGLDIDTRSDIYSLGVLLYELLTGTTPFDSKELMSKGFAEMMRIIREVEPHKPSTRLSSLGDTGTRTAQQRRAADPKKLSQTLKGDLDWIVMRCLEKDRTRRYETANELAMDIKRHLNDETVTAGAPSASYKFRKFVKRNKGQVVAAGVVAAALLIGIAGTTGGMLWAMNERDRAKEAEAATQLELTRTVEIKRLIAEMLSGIDPAKALGADITLLKGILDETSDRLTNGEVNDELIAAELHYIVGGVYMNLGLYPEAERHLPAALEIRLRLLGKEHVDTRGAMNSLALLYGSQGRYAEAETLQVEVAAMSRRLLGDEHMLTLISVGNLAITLSNQGRYAEAEQLHLETLEISKRVLGDEYPGTLMTMHNLASVYKSQGRSAEAESLFIETLEKMKRVLGHENPNTLKCMLSLATLATEQGRYAEAELLHLETLEIRKRVLGDEHPDTLASMSNLGNLYTIQGRYTEAEPLFLETLEIRRRVLGDEHPDTLGSITNLGGLYLPMGRFEDAAAMFETSLPIKRRVLGMGHPWTGFAMQGLAQSYMQLGRRDDAVQLLRELLEHQVASTAALDASAETLNGAAWTLLTHDMPELQDPARGLALATRACAAAESAGGGDLWACLDTLALAQHLTGNTPAAIETEKKALELLPPDAPGRAECEAALARFEAALEEEPDTAEDPGGE